MGPWAKDVSVTEGWPQPGPFLPALLRLALLSKWQPRPVTQWQDPALCNRCVSQPLGQGLPQSSSRLASQSSHQRSPASQAPGVAILCPGSLTHTDMMLEPEPLSPAHLGGSADPSFSWGTADPAPRPSQSMTAVWSPGSPCCPSPAVLVHSSLGHPFLCPLAFSVLRAGSALAAKDPHRENVTTEPGPSSQGQGGTGLHWQGQGQGHGLTPWPPPSSPSGSNSSCPRPFPTQRNPPWPPAALL